VPKKKKPPENPFDIKPKTYRTGPFFSPPEAKSNEFDLLPKDMLVSPKTTGRRKCWNCLDLLDVAEFGEREDGLCLVCAEHNRMTRSKERAEDKAGEMMDLLTIETGNGGLVGNPDAEELVGQLVSAFGSTALFVKYYKDYLDRFVDSEGKPQVGVLNHFSSLFKMILETDKNSHVKDMDKLSLEEIKEEKRRMLLKELMNNADEEGKNMILNELMEAQGITKPMELVNVQESRTVEPSNGDG
jgi:hypothetical protein